MRIIVGLFLLVVWAASPVQPSDRDDALEALRAAIAGRLAVMPEVAKFKWNNRLPIEDLEREKLILDSTVEQATEAGLDQKLAERFLSHQMMAAKHVQAGLFVFWGAAGRSNFDNVADLNETTRPKITELTNQLIGALKAAEPYLERCTFLKRLSAAKRDQLARQVSIEAWSIATSFQHEVVDCRRRY